MITTERPEAPLPLPKLSESEIEWIIEQVRDYIERQRQVFRPGASPLHAKQMATMQPFFPTSTLHSARVVVLIEERVGNPPFYARLVQMGFDLTALPNFSLMAAITFVDTVVSHEPFTDRLLFHELVHVVQYQRLGTAEFAAKYVKGFLSGGSYQAIPLEVNAYELDARFAAAPGKGFSVVSEVQARIDNRRF